MTPGEMPRIVRLRHADGETVTIEADADERVALAKRFDVVAVNSLRARVSLEREGDEVAVDGRIEADLIQTCGISGEDFPVRIEEPVTIRFVPEVARSVPDEEIELEEAQLDEIEYSGDSFDLGEAIAQTLGLAIDPYAEGPNADAARRKAGIVSDEEPSGPLADALRKLQGE